MSMFLFLLQSSEKICNTVQLVSNRQQYCYFGVFPCGVFKKICCIWFYVFIYAVFRYFL